MVNILLMVQNQAIRNSLLSTVMEPQDDRHIDPAHTISLCHGDLRIIHKSSDTKPEIELEGRSTVAPELDFTLKIASQDDVVERELLVAVLLSGYEDACFVRMAPKGTV